MSVNDFKAFAAGDSANVLSQEDYEALATRSSGFQSGVAKSAQLNKVWRQSSIMSATLAQFIADQTGRDVIDDGSTDTLTANLKAAVFNDAVLTGEPIAPTPNTEDNSTRIATTAFVREEGDARYARVNGDATKTFSIAPATQDQHATNLGQFTAFFSGGGYQKLPSGLIIQWGWVSCPENYVANQIFIFNFPIAFPNQVLQFIGSNSGYSIAVSTESQSNNLSQGQVFWGTSSVTAGGLALTYIVIGH